MGEEQMNNMDLLMLTIENRKVYKERINHILKKHSKYKCRLLAAQGNANEIDIDKALPIPELNILTANAELNILDKKMEEDLKSALKEQIRAMAIFKKKMNCPISQKMDKL